MDIRKVAVVICSGLVGMTPATLGDRASRFDARLNPVSFGIVTMTESIAKYRSPATFRVYVVPKGTYGRELPFADGSDDGAGGFPAAAVSSGPGEMMMLATDSFPSFGEVLVWSIVGIPHVVQRLQCPYDAAELLVDRARNRVYVVTGMSCVVGWKKNGGIWTRLPGPPAVSSQEFRHTIAIFANGRNLIVSATNFAGWGDRGFPSDVGVSEVRDRVRPVQAIGTYELEPIFSAILAGKDGRSLFGMTDDGSVFRWSLNKAGILSNRQPAGQVHSTEQAYFWHYSAFLDALVAAGQNSVVDIVREVRGKRLKLSQLNRSDSVKDAYLAAVSYEGSAILLVNAHEWAIYRVTKKPSLVFVAQGAVPKDEEISMAFAKDDR